VEGQLIFLLPDQFVALHVFLVAFLRDLSVFLRLVGFVLCYFAQFVRFLHVDLVQQEDVLLAAEPEIEEEFAADEGVKGGLVHDVFGG
jgi:hypothetical protein